MLTWGNLVYQQGGKRVGALQPAAVADGDTLPATSSKEL